MRSPRSSAVFPRISSLVVFCLIVASNWGDPTAIEIRPDDCFHLRGCHPLCHLTGRMDCASSPIKMLEQFGAEEKAISHQKVHRRGERGRQLARGECFLVMCCVKTHTEAQFPLFHPIPALKLIDKQQHRPRLGYPRNLSGGSGMRCDICVMETKCWFCDRCHCGVRCEAQMCETLGLICGEMCANGG